MTAVSLRDRVTLRAATTVADSQGGRSTSWTDLRTVWGQLRALSAREALQAQALQSGVIGRLILRYRPGATVAQRAYREPTGPLYEITGVRDPDGRQRWLVCDLQEIS